LLPLRWHELRAQIEKRMTKIVIFLHLLIKFVTQNKANLAVQRMDNLII
jgi:hypothetical protein